MIKNKGKSLCGSPYVSEELLRQLLDMIHDFVRTGLLLSYPLHMIGRQLGGDKTERQRSPQITSMEPPAAEVKAPRSGTVRGTQPREQKQ